MYATPEICRRGKAHWTLHTQYTEGRKLYSNVNRRKVRRLRSTLEPCDAHALEAAMTVLLADEISTTSRPFAECPRWGDGSGALRLGGSRGCSPNSTAETKAASASLGMPADGETAIRT